LHLRGLLLRRRRGGNGRKGNRVRRGRELKGGEKGGKQGGREGGRGL